MTDRTIPAPRCAACGARQTQAVDGSWYCEPCAEFGFRVLFGDPKVCRWAADAVRAGRVEVEPLPGGRA